MDLVVRPDRDRVGRGAGGSQGSSPDSGRRSNISFPPSAPFHPTFPINSLAAPGRNSVRLEVLAKTTPVWDPWRFCTSST